MGSGQFAVEWLAVEVTRPPRRRIRHDTGLDPEPAKSPRILKYRIPCMKRARAQLATWHPHRPFPRPSAAIIALRPDQQGDG
jgi:hypothetical protein